MNAYPTMDQYNDAVQYPQTAFKDPALKQARIIKNGMGLPIALGGGFALTYQAAAHRGSFAIRCFHKQALGLEARYEGISRGIGGLGSPYFVGFEFQRDGVLVNGHRYPIVKMDWIAGDTLGTYLEDNYTNKATLEGLRVQFAELEQFLRSRKIAHGDLQNGNVLIKSGLKLIDYDGLYVPGLPVGQGAELGHKHFQHPRRTEADFGPTMDRFSFIVIDLSLRAVAQNPNLFKKYSNGENIVFTANDFADPGRSKAFGDVKAIPNLARYAENLAKICVAAPSQVPTLSDFLSSVNIPTAAVVYQARVSSKSTAEQVAYIGAFSVIDATNYQSVLQHVGDKIELVGRIERVVNGRARNRKPFRFVFFSQGRECVRLNIWSEGLAKLRSAPTETWEGAWVSVQGLIEPPFTNQHGTALTIEISSDSQIRKIDEKEARRRLKTVSAGAQSKASSRNRAILDKVPSGMATARKHGARRANTAKSLKPLPRTKNQAILDSLKPVHGSAPKLNTGYKPPQIKPVPRSPSGTSATRKSSLPKFLFWGAVMAAVYLMLS